MTNQVRQTVVQRKNDPYIYLYVMGEWYCYNPSEPTLGSGAMGDVYCGFKCKDRSRVAIKRVKDYYANNKMIRERAKQEASLAFRHPNLVEMVGYCEYAPTHGPIFLISHFVQGEDIDKYIEKHLKNAPDRVEKICGAISAVLDALDYIHSRGVIHRDIKPSNIMVEQGANVRLMDLGISRMNGGNKFSQYGFIGTPQYSAPEQIKRSNKSPTISINATTDIYELGITFYELLTGKNPMDGASEAETLARQIKDKLPQSDAIPAKLMRVIWKATEKEQSNRYQSALEFKQAIAQALQLDPTIIESLVSWTKAHIMVVWGIGIALIVCMMMVIMLLLT